MRSKNAPNLWEKATSVYTLTLAWNKVRSNGGSGGGDGVSLNDFRPHERTNIRQLHTQILDGTYEPSSCRQVLIPKRKGGVRRLMIPSIRDRIVHTAIAETLKPALEAIFEDSSFAYRPGRSVKQAVAKIEVWRNMGYRHVIEADIISYFDAIRHDLLLKKLSQVIGEHPGGRQIIELVRSSLIHQGNELGTPGQGLVQGSPFSPALANLYLDALDEKLTRRGVRIIRFADDFVVLCKKHAGAEKALAEVYTILGEHGLSLHEDGTKIVDFNKGFDFIGYLFVRSLAVKKTYDDDLNSGIIAEDDLIVPTEKQKPKPRKVTYDKGLSVLYLTDPNHMLQIRNQSFSVRTADDYEVAAILHSRIDRIEVSPNVRINEQVLTHCLATQTDLTFVDGRGLLRGDLRRNRQEKAALQMKQAAAILDDNTRGLLARKFVDARIRNQRAQLFRLNREPKIEGVHAALKAMGRNLRKLPAAISVEQLRGLEGATGAIYWPALGILTKGARSPFRRDRPATDPVNASINYLTAILERDIRAALAAAGLHTGFGILHSAHDYSDAAIYDLMEPFRAPLTEGLTAYLFNARRLRPEMFDEVNNDSIHIQQEARHAIIKGYEQAVAKRVNVTGRTGKLAWRPLMKRQAQDLAKAFRSGDLDAFQPYLMET